MKKEEKATSVAELHEKFSRARLAVMTECSGLPVNDITELRKQLRGAKAEFKVVKNTLAARAVDGTTLVEAKPYFKGPMALMIGYDDPVLPTTSHYLSCIIESAKQVIFVEIKGLSPAMGRHIIRE